MAHTGQSQSFSVNLYMEAMLFLCAGIAVLGWIIGLPLLATISDYTEEAHLQ